MFESFCGFGKGFEFVDGRRVATHTHMFSIALLFVGLIHAYHRRAVFERGPEILAVLCLTRQDDKQA